MEATAMADGDEKGGDRTSATLCFMSLESDRQRFWFRAIDCYDEQWWQSFPRR